MAKAVKAEGQLTEYIQNNNEGSQIFTGIYSYHTVENELYTCESNISSSHHLGKVGQRVEILYLPNDPSYARIKNQ